MKAWHFIAGDRKLNYGDGRLVRKGTTHKVKGEPKLCVHGLHGSIRAIDALLYAPGNIVSRVEIGGTIIKGDNKIVGTERTYLWVADAEETLREFSRWCALQVIDLWEAPDIVIKYLKTGDESIRAAASAAAWVSDWAAARDAARDAWDAARYTAWYTAWHATWDVAWYNAWYVARYAAMDAKYEETLNKFNRKLTTMLNKLGK